MKIEDICMRIARKELTCACCGKKILPGQQYEYHTAKNDGVIFDWNVHETCSFISQEIWKYANCDEKGLDNERFLEVCSEICQEFVCRADCEKWDRWHEECEDNKEYCLEKVAEFFQTNELYRIKTPIPEYKWWGVRKKEGK